MLGVDRPLSVFIDWIRHQKTDPCHRQKDLDHYWGNRCLHDAWDCPYWQPECSFDIQNIQLNLDSPPAVYAFLCLLVGILAKAGAIPLHTWLVDTAEDAPTPVTAFLPASVDKLLAIYLLARMVLNLFVMTPVVNLVLLVLGAVTLAGAGMMMLVQQDFKRLLGYCAVSQVGYVLLGIGTGHPLGIAGGLFHMVNHAIYKSCLFFSGGASN